MNTLEKKYKSIDLSKLPETLKKGLKQLKEDTENFKSKDDKVMQKAEATLDKTISRLKEVLPDAIKPVKAKADPINTKSKPNTPDPDDTPKQRASKIKKPSETKKNAETRAKKELEKESKTRDKKLSALDKLDDYLKNKKLKGFNRDATDVNRDAGREAKPRGKRRSRKGWMNQYGASKGGRTYYENRENRSDRLAPDYPKGLPKLKDGGETDVLEYDVVVQYDTGEPYFIIGENVSKSEAEKIVKDLNESDQNYNMVSTEFSMPFEKGGKLKTDFYIPPYEIDRVVLEDGTVIDAKEDEIMSGIHGSNNQVSKKVIENQTSLFAEGGTIPKHAIYIPNRKIKWIETEFNGIVKSENMYNGVWLKNDRKNEILNQAITEGRITGFENRKHSFLSKKLPVGVSANVIESITKDGATIYGGEVMFKKGKTQLLYKFFPIGSTSESVKKSISSYLNLLKFNSEYSRTNKGVPFYAVVFSDRGRYQTNTFKNKSDADTLKRQLSKIEQTKFESGGRIKSALARDRKYLNSNEEYEVDYAESKRISRPSYTKKDNKLSALKKLNQSRQKPSINKVMKDGGYVEHEVYIKGGDTSNSPIILNHGIDFNKSKYKTIFGDFDNDGRINIDDSDPLNKSRNRKVEQVELKESFETLISAKKDLDETMSEVLKVINKEAPEDAQVFARTKTPYSIVKKLIDKQFKQGKGTLTDLIGTMLVVENKNDADAVAKSVKEGKFGKVLEEKNYYKTPKDGYMAFHYIIEHNGTPVEIQVKTQRMKKLAEASHVFYKDGTLSREGNLEVAKLIKLADEGDKNAISKADSLLNNPTELTRKISVKKKKEPKSNSQKTKPNKGQGAYIEFVRQHYKKGEETWQQAMKRCKPLYYDRK